MRALAWTSLVVTALAAGGVAGHLTRPDAPSSPGRPRPVEAVLRALDAWQAGGGAERLHAALAEVGGTAGWPPSAVEELELARLVAAAAGGPPEAIAAALFPFATGAPPSPARARALLVLADRAGAESSAKALERLRRDYPSSWAFARDGRPR